MSDCEKMQNYIDSSPVPHAERYDMTWVEVLALMYDLPRAEAVSLAFRYGRAKGYRQAKQEARKAYQKRQ